MAGTDFSHLTNDELIKGIQALNLPDYIRSKAYGVDVRETLAQMAEMTIQLGVNMGLSPDDALKWARKLQESVSQSEFDSWVATLLDGGPSIFMNTLSELQTTYPNGATGVALVRETDPAKIYVWNGTAWEDFGDYQGIEIKEGSVTNDKLADRSVSVNNTDFATTRNLAKPNDKVYGLRVTGGLEPKIVTNSGNSYISYVIKVEPNKKYTIATQGGNNLLRAATTTDYPNESSTVLQLLIYDETNDIGGSINFGQITTSNESEYLTIYTTNSGAEALGLQVVEGETKMDNPSDIIVSLDSKSVVDGKSIVDNSLSASKTFFAKNANLLKSGDIVKGMSIIGGGAGIPGTVLNATLENVATERIGLIIPVKSGDTYSVATNGLNSLIRVATTKGYPKVGEEIVQFWNFDEENHNGGDVSNGTFHANGEVNYAFILFSTSYALGEKEVSLYVQNKSYDPYSELEPVYLNIANGNTGNTVINVEDYRTHGMTDYGVIHRAFDLANGNIVALENGRKYEVGNQLMAKIDKVRGIEGNNAKIIGDVQGQAIVKYLGSLTTSGSTGPRYAPNEKVQEDEMNGYINQLNVKSKIDYEADGIEVGNSIGVTVKNCKLYKLRNGLLTSGIVRNFIYSNNYIYNNSENGMLFDDVDIHQFQIIGGHISYNKIDILFNNCDLANAQIVGVSLENNLGVGYEKPESLIAFKSDGVLKNVAKHLYEVIIISGCNFQDHASNTGPLVNVDVINGGMMDLIIADTLVGNSSYENGAIYLKNTLRTTLNSINTASNSGPFSIKLEGSHEALKVVNSDLIKELDYDNASINKMIIANNITSGFSLTDSNDGNILIANNI